MAVDKDFYNEASAAKLGWAPDWFIPGHTLFDRKLQNAIRAFQREHRLLADGMCGPTTYRRILAHVESLQDKYEATVAPEGSDFYVNGMGGVLICREGEIHPKQSRLAGVVE